jgi:hypothetical protein
LSQARKYYRASPSHAPAIAPDRSLLGHHLPLFSHLLSSSSPFFFNGIVTTFAPIKRSLITITTTRRIPTPVPLLFLQRHVHLVSILLPSISSPALLTPSSRYNTTRGNAFYRAPRLHRGPTTILTTGPKRAPILQSLYADSVHLRWGPEPNATVRSLDGCQITADYSCPCLRHGPDLALETQLVIPSDTLISIARICPLHLFASRARNGTRATFSPACPYCIAVLPPPLSHLIVRGRVEGHNQIHVHAYLCGA